MILDRELKPLTDQLEDLTVSVKLMSDKCDEVTKDMERLQLKTDTVVQENKQLKEEVFSLRNELEIQKGIANNLQQYTRRVVLKSLAFPREKAKILMTCR